MKICISCEADVSGKKAWRVREDRVITTVRAVKKALHIVKMNELYVCEGCLPKHRSRRQAFERNMLFATVLGALIIVVMLGMILLSGRLDLWAVVSSFVIGAFVMALPILFSYVPALESPPGPGPAPRPFPLPPAPIGTGSAGKEAGKPARKKQKR